MGTPHIHVQKLCKWANALPCPHQPCGWGGAQLEHGAAYAYDGAMDFQELDAASRVELEAFVRHLQAGIRGITDLGMRTTKLVEGLRRAGPESSVHVLFELYRVSAWGNAGYKQLLQCLTLLDRIIADLGVEHMSAMYDRARHDSNTLVARLLVAPRNPAAFSGRLHPDLEGVPLGVRRQWAKEFDPRRLEILMKDFDPVVIRHLMTNPKVQERHILKMITQRPCQPDVLREAAGHPRWNIRPIIREALALNPWTPYDLTLPLLPLFNRGEALRLLSNPSLPEPVRDAIGEIERLKALSIETVPAHATLQ